MKASIIDGRSCFTSYRRLSFETKIADKKKTDNVFEGATKVILR
jgi:hypothetical protein